MVRFYIKWLEEVLGVEKKDITARLTVNVSYKDKVTEIEEYWATTTGIPSNQFTKPFYQITQWKKQYKNNNYFGVLRVHVRGSLDHFLTMKGWIAGLYDNLK